MKETQILSAFHDTRPSPSDEVLIFDACHVGVVMRAVFFGEAVTAVAAMFRNPGPQGWLADFSLLSWGVLPAVLVWLMLLCACRRMLARLPLAGQVACGVSVGGVSGLYGCGLLAWAGVLREPPWLSSVAAGLLMSGVMVAGLVARARGRMPADTTARLAELQSRIRPHFLFNTLNSAIALVRAEPAKAESLLEDLSDLFREALRDPRGRATLGEEIALARRYLQIEQVRFGERLQVRWDLDPGAAAAVLPPLLLQPLVENAVRHGVEPSACGGRIDIATRCEAGMVVVKVRNTVPDGVGPTPGHGIGLRNVRDRLALMHDVQGQFDARLHQGLYTVRMAFPLRTGGL